MPEALLTSETFSQDNLIAGHYPIITKGITLLSGENRTRGALLGKITKALGSIDATGNTGNGTMTAASLSSKAKLGNYKAECISAPVTSKTVPSTGTANGGNTGNGTMSSVSGGASVKVGTYNAECISAPVTSKTVPSTGTAGANTGNGTMTSVSGGASVKVGTYKIKCITAATNAGTFKVIDPDGVRLDDASVGVAYTSAHLNFTLNDGTTDFIVGDEFTVAVTGVGNSGVFKVTTPDGERLNDATVGVAYTSPHLNLTINDGTTDFIVGDKFTVAVAAVGNSGVFKVTTPDGERLDDATVGVAYTSPHLNFTVNDGTTDFIVGDKFTIPVAAGSGKHKLSLAAAVDGSQDPDSILAKDTDASAGDVVSVAYETGEFNDNVITFGTGHTAASVKDTLKDKNIFLKTPVKA